MMTCINRVAFLVRAKEPYFTWARTVEDDSTIEESEHTPTVYLAESDEDKAADMDLVKKHFERIFEEELESWWTDTNSWPQPRTWEMFQAWFTVTISDLVNDLEDTAIEAY